MKPWRTAIFGLLTACTPAPAGEPAPGGVDLASGGQAADLARALAFFASRPEFERPFAVGDVVPGGVAGLRANDCAACHAEIAAEWRLSTHAHAWVDPQFQVEIRKSDNRWLCVNCHTPLLRQQAEWPVGLVNDDVERPLRVPNPALDAQLRDEGITCAACHLTDDGHIRGPGLATPSRAPHPVRIDEDLRGDGLCLRCHQATATYPGKGFVCTFRTGEEWAAGPWAREGVGCVDCHMPRVDRPAATGGPNRSVARHFWRGAGIPKVEGVQPPHEANPPGLDVDARWAGDTLGLRLTNARAGHHLPSGDPERFILVEIQWFDERDRPTGDPYTLRVGQTWRWWPTPEKLGDNRLRPREQRAVPVAIPRDAVRAEIQASSHRMTREIQAYHALRDYPISTVTHRLRVSASGSEGGLVKP